MKRFEMIIFLVLIIAASHADGIFGLSGETHMILAVAGYVLLVEIVKYLTKEFRIMVIKKVG